MAPGNPSAIAAEYLRAGRSDDCPIIDLHGHWGPFGGLYMPESPEAQMIRGLRRAGVRHIACSSHDALTSDPVPGQSVHAVGHGRNPDVLSGYWLVNPNFPDLAAGAAKDFQKSRGFMGFKFLPDYHCYPITGDRCRPAMEYANEMGLLVLVHTWGGSASIRRKCWARSPRAIPRHTS